MAKLTETRVPILLYHSITNDACKGYRQWTVTPEMFRQQMQTLVEQGFTPFTVSSWLVHRRDPQTLPNRPVLITFDDGLGDFYRNALPILIEFNLKATLYLTTGFIGRQSRWLQPLGQGHRQMMTWSQTIETQAAGIEIGAHTVNHLELDSISEETAYNEITNSKKEIENTLGLAVRSFAYPHGYHSPRTRQFVIDAGYSSACAVKHASSHFNDDPYALSRIVISHETDFATFNRYLHGQDIAVAPKRERIMTKGWRVARRSARHLNLALAT